MAGVVCSNSSAKPATLVAPYNSIMTAFSQQRNFRGAGWCLTGTEAGARLVGQTNSFSGLGTSTSTLACLADIRIRSLLRLPTKQDISRTRLLAQASLALAIGLEIVCIKLVFAAVESKEGRMSLLRSQRMSSNAAWALRFAVVVLSTMVPAWCLSQSQESAKWLTQDQIYYIRVVIAEFDSLNGRLPENLEEICQVGVPCPWMLPEDNLHGLKDGWGAPFIYDLVDGEYELGSAGPDKRAGTADDIRFRPSVERARVSEAAGCYRADLVWWKEYAGGELVLDTLVLAPGAFVLKPSQQDYSMASWQLLPRDSVVLEWAEVDAIARLRLKVTGDSLVGVAAIPRYRARRVVAHRTQCP